MMSVRWGAILIGGVLAELAVFAIVFPTLHFFGQPAFLASILLASAAMPFAFTIWIGRRLSFGFVLHGALIGCVAMLFYLALAWGQPQPLLYKIAHVLKVLGGMAGGWYAGRRALPPVMSAPSASSMM